MLKLRSSYWPEISLDFAKSFNITIFWKVARGWWGGCHKLCQVFEGRSLCHSFTCQVTRKGGQETRCWPTETREFFYWCEMWGCIQPIWTKRLKQGEKSTQQGGCLHETARASTGHCGVAGRHRLVHVSPPYLVLVQCPAQTSHTPSINGAVCTEMQPDHKCLLRILFQRRREPILHSSRSQLNSFNPHPAKEIGNATSMSLSVWLQSNKCLLQIIFNDRFSST